MSRASAIVRTRDSERTLERCLAALRRQTVPVEIVVVDSGSRDGTLGIARRECDELVEMPADEFSYGRALNLGADVASAPVHVAVSSHVAVERDDWVERALGHYENPKVAAAGGYGEPGPRGQRGVVLQDMAQLRADPYWGLSNTAGSWRAEAWRELRFDESLEAAEDREWSWRALQAGWLVAMDPALEVRSDHRTAPGVRSLYRRQWRESRAIAGFAGGSPISGREVLRDWWRAPPGHRVSPWHVSALLGRYRGERSARRAA